MLLPIDTVSLPFRRRFGLYMTRPEVRLEPVLGPDGHVGWMRPEDIDDPLQWSVEQQASH